MGTGMGTGVAQRKELTRRALAETATALFLERGYDATTVEDIAAAVDVSPRTFFRYFPAKSDIITAVARTSLDDVIAELKVLAPGGPVAAAVADGVVITLSKASPSAVRSFERLLATSDQLRSAWAEECRRNQSRLADALGAACGLDPAALPIQVAASAVIVTVETALASWARDDRPGDGDDSPIPTVRQALGLLDGLFPDAGAPERPAAGLWE